MLVQCSSLSSLDTSMQQPIISTLCLATFYANSISATWEVLKVLAWSYKKAKLLENSKLALVCCSDELRGWVSSNRLNSESCTATSPYHPLELTGNFLVTVS